VPPTVVLALAQSTSQPGVSPGALLLVALVVLVLLAAARAASRRRAQTCARYGHAPDPAAPGFGTRGERCARCGQRLR
jgi:hypothetical protein